MEPVLSCHGPVLFQSNMQVKLTTRSMATNTQTQCIFDLVLTPTDPRTENNILLESVKYLHQGLQHNMMASLNKASNRCNKIACIDHDGSCGYNI